MGRGKRTAGRLTGATTKTVAREIALSDGDGRVRSVPEGLASSLQAEATRAKDTRRGRWLSWDQVVQVYPEGQTRFVGEGRAMSASYAEVKNRDRPRVLHARAYLSGEVAMISDYRDDVVAEVHPEDSPFSRVEVVHARTRRSLGSVHLADNKASAVVFDQGGGLAGTVRLKRGHSGPMDVRLAAVAAFCFLLDH